MRVPTAQIVSIIWAPDMMLLGCGRLSSGLGFSTVLDRRPPSARHSGSRTS
ncbi:uncharacterized protein RAG0_04611 [Rhynchosporium agropyri]|uniref:Uncharacterized protein n=2 Tax=Rhynchosporium TaxID=38037 RepID=A0A1E1MDS0_RHYSE|nr:uncharacterized protein RAG0_04611 [Rhynchosporium agropyri]CZT47253.1 uncharacterized protein RSE6_07793 [Rhynchosporium secalis]